MDAERAAPPPGGVGPFSVAYRRYALALLVVVYVFNFIDRQILSILLQEIKEEFRVSDSALGFLTGPAFALFYTVLGIPIARWADRGPRASIIALAVLVWSGMTALTGFVSSFAQLAAARVGVGVGEAGCSPPAHSLISDAFPADRRSTALGIYSLGIPIGGGIGLLAGGWINEFFDWRTAFLAVGLPGVALALLVKMTLREPRRGGLDAPVADDSERPSLREVLALLARLRSFRHMAIAAALHAFYAYGVGAFSAAFFVRSHGMPTGELSSWLAGLLLTGGVAGTYLGGHLSDRFGSRDQRWYMWVPALATLSYIPFAILLYTWPDPRVALALSLPGSVLGYMYLGPTFAMTQTLVSPAMRATASAILLFVINLIGLGLGPQGVGFLSDLLAPRFGVESLRYALLCVCITFALWSVLHYGLASRTLRADLSHRGSL